MLIRKNKLLKNYTTFHIGGRSDLVIIKSEKDLIDIIEKIKKEKLSFFVLGGGSNILFNDKKFNGLILKIEINSIKIKEKEIIISGAGVSLSKIILFCLKNYLSGLEWAYGIPGTLGGAIRGNAGAFNKSMKDSVLKVRVYNIDKNKIEVIDKKKCQFDYRESLFKNNSNYIITKAELKFKKKKKSEIEKEMKEYFQKRKKTQPIGFSAGSIFKNYKIKEKSEKELILKKFPEIKKVLKNDIIPAGYLIEKCNLKGKKIGGAVVSEIHSNFIINKNKAKFDDVKKLIKISKKEIKDKFGIKIEEEIVIV